MGTLPMTFDVFLSAEAMIGGRKQTVASSAITFEIVQGYRVEPPVEPVEIRGGGVAEISGAFHRERDFTAPVTVKVNNLPLGVACEPAEVRGAPARYRLSCEAGPDAQPR